MESIKKLLTALTEIGKAVAENLGRDAIYTPAAEAYRLVLHSNPWLAWELAVQFHLGKEEYEHAIHRLYNEGELGLGEEIDKLILMTHYLNVMNREEEIGCVCMNCYKRIEYDEISYSMLCLDCFFEIEVGAITVPTRLESVEPIHLINSSVISII